MTAASPIVLVAEHHSARRAFLAENLYADGYWPVCAADCAAALELLSGAPDALIVDVNGDTLALVDAIRDECRAAVDPPLPILVVTSEASVLHRTRLLERGADDVLTKPYSYPELRARLGALCAARTPAARRVCSAPGRYASTRARDACGSASSRSTRCAARNTSCCWR